MPRVPPVTTAHARAVARRRHARAPSSARRPRPRRSRRRRRPARRSRPARRRPVALGLRAARAGSRPRTCWRTRSTLSATRSRGSAELGGGRLDDARVGLVGDEQVDVVDGQAGGVERRRRSPRPSARPRGGRPRGPPCAACARRARRRAGRPARASPPRRSAPTPSSRLAAGDDDGAGAVAEQHGGAAVVVVGDAATAPRRRRPARRRRGRSRPARRPGRAPYEEAGAGGVEVDRARRRSAPMQPATSGARPGVTRSGVIVETMIWSTSVGVAARRRPARRRRPRRPAAPAARPPSSQRRVADAGAPDDPVVVGVQALRRSRRW